LVRFLVNSTLSMALLLACALLSWHLLSKANFLFEHIYEYNELQEHIEKYAPQNRNRENFEDTSKEERVRIFGEMVVAINNNGSGLDEIEYKISSTGKIDSFLTDPEKEHLLDVSDLVSSANRIGLIISATLASVYFICLAYKIRSGRSLWQPAALIASFFNICIFIFLLAAIVFIIGPREVFHQLHEWFFANKGQWYFYYQDSLMTTLLPDHVFGTISVLLIALTLALWACATFAIYKALK